MERTLADDHVSINGRRQMIDMNFLEKTFGIDRDDLTKGLDKMSKKTDGIDDDHIYFFPKDEAKCRNHGINESNAAYISYEKVKETENVSAPKFKKETKNYMIVDRRGKSAANITIGTGYTIENWMKTTNTITTSIGISSTVEVSVKPLGIGVSGSLTTSLDLSYTHSKEETKIERITNDASINVDVPANTKEEFVATLRREIRNYNFTLIGKIRGDILVKNDDDKWIVVDIRALLKKLKEKKIINVLDLNQIPVQLEVDEVIAINFT